MREEQLLGGSNLILVSLPDIEAQTQKQGEQAERYIIKLLKPLCGRDRSYFTT